MKTEEFNLSERIRSDGCVLDVDIKEFIKRLKKFVYNGWRLKSPTPVDFLIRRTLEEIDKLAGDKLVEQKENEN